MKINPKSQKGAITLVVLVAMLFLIAFLMSLYIGIANKARTSAETTKQIKERYNNLGEEQVIYDSYFANTDIIPIYTREHLKKIGSEQQIEINGKIYKFSPNAYYTLQNDIDLGGYYDETTKTWTAEAGDEWSPLPSTFTGTLDGLGHTIAGIYLGENEGTQGIFEQLNGTIKNIHVKNSYKITNMNGLLAGVNNGEIINCYYEKVLIGLKVGDYVNYTPTEGTYKVAEGDYGSGHTEIQSFTTETGENALKWRILSIDEKTGEIDLVSEKVGQTLHLKGTGGYNHGVDILNDLCEVLYSKTVNGKKIAKGRSIKIEDINAKTTFDYTKFEDERKYGDVISLNEVGVPRYARLYEKEDGFYLGGVKQKGGITESEGLGDGIKNEEGITEYKTVTGRVEESEATEKNVSVTYTFYSYDPNNNLKKLGINTAPRELLLYSFNDDFWIASRCVWILGGSNCCSLRAKRGAECSAFAMVYDWGGFGNYDCAVRPVVTLSALEQLDFSVGNGSKEKPWGMK